MIIKDYSEQPYQETDDKSFEIKTFREEKLFDPIPGLDDEKEIDRDMYNFGDEEDLPDSDRETVCRERGISRNSCFNP
ncbi:MAG: hypothetical protein ACI4OW_02125 [Alphaproteobacteria bacterium]